MVASGTLLPSDAGPGPSPRMIVPPGPAFCSVHTQTGARFTCRRASWNLTNLLPLVCMMGAVTHLLPSGLRCASMGTKDLPGLGEGGGA